MKQSIPLTAFLSAVCCASSGFAQHSPPRTDEPFRDATSPAPVAYVYVSNINGGGGLGNNIYAYAAAANGQLTTVPGSPFQTGTFTMGVNGKYLIAVDGSAFVLDSFLMEPDGALTQVQSRNISSLDPGNCGQRRTLKIDHSGKDLYFEIIPCGDIAWLSFKIEPATGELDYFGQSSGVAEQADELDFLGDDNYAYSPGCKAGNGDLGIFGFQRLDNGELKEFSPAVTFPKIPQNGNFYCPQSLATDPTNHFAALLVDLNSKGKAFGSSVIGTFTADSNGNLTTASTYHDMPAETVGTGYYQVAPFLRMSPSGKLLAVAGGGLEVFHYNGTSPVTKFQTLLSNASLTQAYWDNNNHLYAIGKDSSGDGMLWVYTVTPTSIAQAPGSPYPIPLPDALIVQPR